jgi:hypothetical protein
MGERTADLACTDERDLFPGHGLSLGFDKAKAFYKVALFAMRDGVASSQQKVNRQGFAAAAQTEQAYP